MAYKKFFKQSPNYTKGTSSAIKAIWGVGGRTYKEIAIHWWDKPEKRPSFEGVINTFMNPARQASATYVAEAGRVCQMVKEEDVSWATNRANPWTISIECNPRQTNADYQTIAELIADIWKRRGKLPLVPHRKYAQTECCGTYDLKRLTAMAEKILTPPVKTPTVNVVYKRYASSRVYKTNKQPTTLWNFSASTWGGMKRVADFDKGAIVKIYGEAHHPSGSVYLMTKFSFGEADKTGKPYKPNGFNIVDMLRVTEVIPAEPAVTKVPPPIPKPDDKTDEEAVAGGQRKAPFKMTNLWSAFWLIADYIKKLFKKG